MQQYEIIMGYGLSGVIDPDYAAVAQAVEELKDYIPDSSVLEVNVYDREIRVGPESDTVGVRIIFQTEEMLDYDEVVLGDDGISSAETLEHIG